MKKIETINGQRNSSGREESPPMEIDRRHFLQLAAGGLGSMLLIGFEGGVQGAKAQAKGKLAFKVATFRGPSGASIITRVLELRPEFFADEGIEVSWDWYSDVSAYYGDIISGATDLNHALGPNVVAAARLKGAPLQVVFSSARYVPAIVKRVDDKSLKALADLKGKRFGVAKGSYYFQWTKWLAARGGLDLETDVRLVDSPWLAQRKYLEVGEVDVAMIDEPQLSLLFHDNPGKYEILFNAVEAMEKATGVAWVPTIWVVVNEGWAKKHREEVARFYRAFKRAGEWFNKNYKQIGKALSKPYESGGTSIPEAVLVDAAGSGRLSYTVAPAAQIEDALMKPLQALADVGALAGVPSAKDFIYREPLR